MVKEPLQKILLIEDDIDIQEIARLALCTIGNFSVDVFSSGIEALTKAPQLFPQLVLLDVMMPNMDGPTTLQRLRQLPHFVSIPVVFLTAKVQSHEVENYKKMGAADVISKPFDPMTLATIVTDIWNRYGTSIG